MTNGDSPKMRDSRARLEALLLPGTPESVRNSYLTLAERARITDFGLLEDDVVVLDTETTGLSFRDCRLIEISAARLSGRTVTARYQTFVHPGTPIPDPIAKLTGITNLDVADAPNPEDAVAGLAEFVGAPILAHNATFDRTFVESVRGGREVSDTWIDTLSLSRVALPRLASHRLADMAEAFGCDSVTHRASDDVDALCGMWRVILCALSDLPHGLLGLLADMHPDVSWPFRPVLAHLAAEGSPTSFSLKSTRHDLLAEAHYAPRPDASERQTPFDVPSRTEIGEEFLPGGAVARMYETYERRPEQVAMATQVRDAISTSTYRAIEAGTGVGKSIAYLLPEVLFASATTSPSALPPRPMRLPTSSCHTSCLRLRPALPDGLTFYSLKGYDHYPCLHRLDRAVLDELPLGAVLLRRQVWKRRVSGHAYRHRGDLRVCVPVARRRSRLRWASAGDTYPPDAYDHARGVPSQSLPVLSKRVPLHGARRRAAERRRRGDQSFASAP